MLKIKDDVDLKELEKFGWIYDEDDGFLGTRIVPHYYKDFDYYNQLTVSPKDRIIYGDHDEGLAIKESEILEYGWIDDIIKAGLVEKIENQFKAHLRHEIN